MYQKRQKSNYLILFLIQRVEICTVPSPNTITHLFHLWKIATSFERWNTEEFYHWLGEAGIYPEMAHREPEDLQDSNRNFEAVEKSLWIPLFDTAIMSAFSDEILLPWKTLLKISWLLFSNINLLKIPLML